MIAAPELTTYRTEVSATHPPDGANSRSWTFIAIFDGHAWSVLCAELDIASEGPTRDAAIENVRSAVQEALAVAAEKNIEPGDRVSDDDVLAFLEAHVGPEAVGMLVCAA